MNYETLHDRIVHRLLSLVDQRGRGARSDLQEALEVGSTFFYDLNRQKGRLPMDKITQLLGLLEVHPAQFFYEALRDPEMPGLESLRRIGGRPLPQTADPEVNQEVADILQIVEERIGGEGL